MTKLATIVRSDRRIFYCLIQGEKTEIRAKALGLLLKNADLVVGDLVQVQKMENDEYEIVEREDRQNEIYRFVMREQKKKVTVANVDLMAIVVSCSRPDYKVGLIDRYLVRAYQWNIPAVIVFNKYDEYSDKSGFDLDTEVKRYQFLQIPSYVFSALYPEKYSHEGNNFEKYKDFIKDKKVVFLGQSGVGKSKIIQALCGDRVLLKSTSLGKAQKGVHTTTWSQLVGLDHFTLVDTPGIRSYSLEDIPADELIDHFPSLKKLSSDCAFPHCDHNEKQKGCGIWDYIRAAQEGADFIESWLASYQQIYSEVNKNSWDKNNFRRK